MNSAQRRKAARIIARQFPQGASVFVATGDNLSKGKVIGLREQSGHGNYRTCAACVIVKAGNGRPYFRRPDTLVINNPQ